MQISARAILCSARPHGETGSVVRLLTERQGLLAGYVAGARGRRLRPVLIPGNIVDLELRARSEQQLPFARVELVESRGMWLSEPLPAAAIGWVCALTSAALPERHSYPSLYQALEGLLAAICHAPSARGWAGALLAYEALLLRDLGYGGGLPPMDEEWPDLLVRFDRTASDLAHYLLADRCVDVMAARAILRERLGRIAQ